MAEGVYCYVDGMRFDGASIDMSAGGMFLKTDKKVPLGATIATVFKLETEAPVPVFLLGRVVRWQQIPCPGVGVQWVRAVSNATRLELARFLRTRLRLDETPDVEIEWGGESRDMRSSYDFRAAPLEIDRPEPAEDTEPSVLDDYLAEEGSELPPPIPPESPAEEAESLLREETDPGPITQRVTHRQLRAPSRLNATVILDGHNHPSRVTELGLTSLLAHVMNVPKLRPGIQVKVRFPIITQGEDANIICHCRWFTSHQAPEGGTRLELEIDEVDEGGHTGILHTYVKWLHFRSLKSE